MPFSTVRLRPGVTSELTPVLNQAGYSLSQLGRFKAGLFQKLGGWVNYVNSTISGITRALHAWEDLNQNGWLGVGTSTTLDVVENATTVSNISPQIYITNPSGTTLLASDGSQILASDGSPIVLSGAPDFSTTNASTLVTIVDTQLSATVTTLDSIVLPTPVSVGGLILVGFYPINTVLSADSYTIVAASPATSGVSHGGSVPRYTTTSGSAIVSVNLPNHGLSVGQTYVDPLGTAVGGLTIQGGYNVTGITDANNFQITASAQATSSTSESMNGGGAQIVYQITLGPPGSGTAYGFGTYGSGPYGGTGSVGSVQTGVAIAASNWTLDNWGQDLVACPAGGTIYFWNPTGSNQNASPIRGAPLYNTGVFVSSQFQITVAYGSTPVPNGIGYLQDPLFVRWSDQGNLFQWTETATNQAGGQRLYSGSKIVSGYGGPNLDLLWTDLDVWAMNYVGEPFIYGFNKIGDNCGLIGQHAFAALAGQIYWIGQNNFFVTSGNGVAVLPCSVWDVIFQDLDPVNSWKCVAWSNTPFDEFWAFYPSISGGIGECDKYVKFNTVEQTWDFGQLQRSAAIDQSVLGNPIAATRGGSIYLHETGYDGAGTPLNPYLQTGFFELGDGEEYAYVDRVYPDMRWGTYAGSQGATLQITLYSQNYPGDTPAMYGPYTVTQATEFIPVRIRARYMAMNIQSSDAGSFWRLGGLKYRFAPSGRR